MPNHCFYSARIVGRRKCNVKRFLAILKYQDTGFKPKDGKEGLYFCRTFDAVCENGILKDGKLYYADVFGDVAWSIASCWLDGEQTYANDRNNHRWPNGIPENREYEDAYGRKVIANYVITAPDVCKLLGCAIEIWSSEPGMGFQEHYLIDPDGSMTITEVVGWTEAEIDENTGEPVPNTEAGGFEDFGDIRDPEALYGRDLR